MPLKNTEARKQYKTAWYKKNRRKILQDAKAYREANADAVSESKKRIYHERYKLDPAYKASASAYGKKRRQTDIAHVKEIEKRSREKHADTLRAYNRAQVGTPKRLARQAVTYAVRNGKLPRAADLTCVNCGKPANHYHHFAGYKREHRLTVEPVCYQCHKNHHLLSNST